MDPKHVWPAASCLLSSCWDLVPQLSESLKSSPLLQFVRELHLEAQRTSSSFWRCPSFLQYHHAICFLLFSGPTDQLVLFAEEIFKLAAFFCFCHPPSTRWDFCIQEQSLLPRSVEERWPAQLSTFSREERWWIRKLIFSFALWRPQFSFLLSCSLTDRQLLLQGFIFPRIVVWHFSKLLLSVGPFLSSTVYLLLLSYLHASPHVFHCLNYCRGIHSCIYILQNKNCIIKLIMETMIIDCRR